MNSKICQDNGLLHYKKTQQKQHNYIAKLREDWVVEKGRGCLPVGPLLLLTHSTRGTRHSLLVGKVGGQYFGLKNRAGGGPCIRVKTVQQNDHKSIKQEAEHQHSINQPVA